MIRFFAFSYFTFTTCTLVAGVLFALWMPNVAQAQSAAGEQATIESRYIVDMPTAGVLSKGRFSVEANLFAQGGAFVQFYVAPFANVNVGLSFGGTGFVGNSAITFQSLPGFHLRFRPLDETITIPAVTIGLSTQGRGPFYGRFETHSPGVYIAASKNFSFLGTMALHAGINYSFEPSPSDRTPNLYCGLEKSIGNIISLSAEYNATMDNPYTMSRRGLLNAGLRVATGRGFTFELQVRDILQHLRGSESNNRAVRMEFVGAF